MLQIDNSVAAQVYPVPKLIFSLSGNPKSAEVIRALQSELSGCKCVVFSSQEEIQKIFMNGVTPDVAVALFDHGLDHEFKMRTRLRAGDKSHIPSWTSGVVWLVEVSSTCKNTDRCARQIRADFSKNFERQLDEGNFPWGLRKKNESPIRHVQLPMEDMDNILQRLNNGPNLAAMIAHTEKALELPKDSRISWVRIPHSPIGVERSYLLNIVQAFRQFEIACNRLVRENINVHETVLAGVSLADDSRLRNLYLFPRSECFSVGRPDLHFTGSGLFASENDEMPGGFSETVHLDNAYGIHHEEWKVCFDWLAGDGLLLFVISHKWSECYIPELEWLASHLKNRGYNVATLVTNDLSELSIQKQGVFFRGDRVHTVWRQFPIFETAGKLVDLVQAAHEGHMRMVPEFAHFGNKVWFSLFRSYAAFFRSELNPDVYSLLDEILPDSHLVCSSKDFPANVAGVSIGSLHHLRTLPTVTRDLLVMKVVGANERSARSYGVLMGHGLNPDVWTRWIDERMQKHEPFIIQKRLDTAVVRIPVLNTKSRSAEFFNARVLVRPWILGGKLVSANACAVPSSTLRVHGMVDMAVAPVNFY